MPKHPCAVEGRSALEDWYSYTYLTTHKSTQGCRYEMCVSPQLACPSRRRYYSRHGVPRAAPYLSHPPHQFRIIRLATQHPVQPHRQLSSHSHLGDLTAAAKFQPPICSPQFRILSRRRLSGFTSISIGANAVFMPPLLPFRARIPQLRAQIIPFLPGTVVCTEPAFVFPIKVPASQ